MKETVPEKKFPERTFPTTAAKNLMNFGTCFFKTQKFELFNLPQSVEGLRERVSVSLSIV